MLPLYLCVLQGETVDQIRAWYNAVKAFPFRNWAFAGTQYKRIAILLEQLAIMLQEGMLDDTIWIHNLGVEKLSLTCAYTTIQETLTELLGHPVKVSYDSASPFNEVNEHHKCFKAYNLTKRGFSLSTGQVPDSPRFIGSDMPFPYQSISAISKGLTLGHLCVNPKPQKGSTWDQLSCMILQNHNLDVVISGIIAAHSRYQLPRDEALQVCPTWLVHAKEGIRRVLFSETPMTVINQYRSAFDMLSKQVDALADEFR